MMAALEMGNILSYLVKKPVHWAIFICGVILFTYFKLPIMAVAVIASLTAVIYFAVLNSKEAE